MLLSFELLIRKTTHLEGHKDRFLVILDSWFTSKYIGIAMHVLRGDLNDNALTFDIIVCTDDAAMQNTPPVERPYVQV